jgi:SNF2 family DNA or RNA helicase
MDLVKERLNTTLIEPYQPNGIAWMIQREKEDVVLFDENMPRGGIVADEVGLGKTILSIGTMLGNYLNRTLIILPKSLVCQWESQIKQFTSFLHVHVVRKSSDTITLFDNDPGHVYIMSQSLLNLRNSKVGTSVVHDVQWDRIIVDEAHMLRNCKSKLYEACSMLRTNIRWALTATPVMNRMVDYVNIMQWIGVSKFLCQGEKSCITDRFILRRTKEDVKSYNPSLKMNECIVQVKNIPFQSVEEADMYLKVFNQERRMIQTKIKTTTTDLLEHLLRIRQICIHPQLYFDGIAKKDPHNMVQWSRNTTKVKALLSCLREQPAEDKSIVFCQFTKEMDIYQNVLDETEFKCVRLDGRMSLGERDKAVKSFCHDASVRVFLVQINTGGTGINLQVANRIYITAPNWNPALEYQAIGRAHRTGQQKTVYVTKFCITSGDAQIPFIEENILKLHQRKKDIIANILNDARIANDKITSETFMADSAGSLSAKEIKALFNIHQLKS